MTPGRSGDEFGDEADAPMALDGLLLLLAAVVASWAAAWPLIVAALGLLPL